MRYLVRVLFMVGASGIALGIGCSSGAGAPAPVQHETISAEQALREGYLPTPFGLIHPSCVHTVAGGAGHELASCTHPGVDTALASSARTDGWTAASWFTAPNQIGYLAADFVVPQAPRNAGDQTLFFFPSLKPAGTVPGDGHIIQPVLQWGGSAAGGGQYWAVAAWELADLNTVFNSELLQVNSGDTIHGVIQGNGPCPDGACQNWTVTATDVTTGQSETLTNMAGHAYTQANAGVLEQYGVGSCDQYPDDTGISFTNVVLQDQDFNALTPTWTNTVYSNISPHCQFATTSTATSTTISY